ncbi:2-oxoacid:acceptor oxidoreductase family protein [Yinghuangia seranimata]|uniref:2-oxoacid:acceptor oxidoreductase family protein n=1 Tax=Yinghuangia seranimata TaxID=408067 RepID=UPI00248BCB52|nr:2-oxoacid:acceptor oxidoreductase family protein [Yinghuangia seranimata]MDI2131191.1 2-oxoacid:acceptor oxidoreductase family protein [Yinghuangia seranimata]
MQREILWTGIGGQGVQLGTELLAHAALAEGRHAMFFGSYGGMMRGGNSETTLVLGDAPVESPPTVGSAWSALVLHPAHAAGPLARLRPDGVLVLNTTLCVAASDHPGPVVRIPATEIAAAAGSTNAVTMVALGAYAAATAVVRLDTLDAVLPDVLPPYRHRHLAVNRAALRAGHAAALPLVDAWAVEHTPEEAPV